MLPSRRDEIRVALSTERVVIARIARRRRPSVVAKQVVNCGRPAGADWHPSTDALAAMLKEERWANADATVVVSNHFVRYALVPWSNELTSGEEKLAWVQHHFAGIYGDMAGVDYRWSEDRPDAPCVATALNRDMVDRINNVFEATSLRLRSIQPYFMATFNRWKRHIKGHAVWIVSAEPGTVCLASIVGGKWHAFVSRKLSGASPTELAALVERELMLADDGELPETIFALTPGLLDFKVADAKPPRLRRLEVSALEGFSPLSDSDYAMALTGIA